jgi:hypothetical protein
MAIGCFLGIGAASTDQAIVDRHREAVHTALAAAQLPDYRETDSLDAAVDRYMAFHGQARCSSDTVDAAVVSRLGRMIMRARGDAAGPFRDLALTAERIFVPGDFADRIEATGVPGRALWSTGALKKALLQAALVLGLPTVNGEVLPAALAKVNSRKKLSKGDLATPDDTDEGGFSVLDHYRPTWLTLSEFCRLAHDNQLALVLS